MCWVSCSSGQVPMPALTDKSATVIFRRCVPSSMIPSCWPSSLELWWELKLVLLTQPWNTPWNGTKDQEWSCENQHLCECWRPGNSAPSVQLRRTAEGWDSHSLSAILRCCLRLFMPACSLKVIRSCRIKVNCPSVGSDGWGGCHGLGRRWQSPRSLWGQWQGQGSIDVGAVTC